MFFYRPSPSSPNCAIFNAVTDSIDVALYRHSTPDIMVFRDFNVHHKEWFVHSCCTDAPAVSAFNFAVSHDLTRIISALTQIPD